MKRRTLLKRAVAGASSAGLLAGCVGRREAPGGGAGEPDGDATTDEPTSARTDGAGSGTTGETTAGTGGDATTTTPDETTADEGGRNSGDGDATEGETGSDGSGDDSSDGSGDGGETTTDPGTDREGAPLAEGVRDRSVDADGRCLEGDESAGKAGVTFEDGNVVVSGAFRTPDPCYEPVVAASSHTGGVYEIVVEPHQITDENGDPVVCQQCVGILEYEATVAFETPPDRVVVKHGPETVAEERR